MILLGFTPILKKNIMGVIRASHLSSPFSNLTKGLAARRLFRVPHCHEGTIHLKTSMPSPTFEPRPHGTAASVTNHHTGWAAMLTYNIKSKKTNFNILNEKKNHETKIAYYEKISLLGMRKIRKTPAGLDCPIVLSEILIPPDDDYVCTVPLMADKDILEFVQS
ncbi:hypothetical protein TNCV_4211601 [Trichonephila clavipes]|nr:hypothetical protein TNCV_4211601 [Trichonephila clavipes]